MNIEIYRAMHGWFGTPWNACLNDDGTVDEDMRIPVPLGKLCLWCDEEFVEGDSGKAMPLFSEPTVAAVCFEHRECLMRSVVGGLDHLAGRCICHGEPPKDGLGSLADGMTLRQEALAVDEYVVRHWI